MDSRPPCAVGDGGEALHRSDGASVAVAEHLAASAHRLEEKSVGLRQIALPLSTACRAPSLWRVWRDARLRNSHGVSPATPSGVHSRPRCVVLAEQAERAAHVRRGVIIHVVKSAQRYVHPYTTPCYRTTYHPGRILHYPRIMWEGGREGRRGSWSQGLRRSRLQGLRRVRCFAEFFEFRDQVVVPLEVSCFVEGGQGLDPPGAFTHIRGFFPLLSDRLSVSSTLCRSQG